MTFAIHKNVDFVIYADDTMLTTTIEMVIRNSVDLNWLIHAPGTKTEQINTINVHYSYALYNNCKNTKFKIKIVLHIKRLP